MCDLIWLFFRVDSTWPLSQSATNMGRACTRLP